MPAKSKYELTQLFTDPKMRALIDSLWRDFLKLYNEQTICDLDKDKSDPESANYDSRYVYIKNRFKEIGEETETSYASVIGFGNKLLSDFAQVFGFNNETASMYETIIGVYATIAQDQDPDNWVETDRLFAGGNGTSAERSNWIEVFKSGFVKYFNAIQLGEFGHGDQGAPNGTLQFKNKEIWGRKYDYWREVMLLPRFTFSGAIFFYNGYDVTRLPIGNPGDILQVSGGQPTWQPSEISVSSKSIYQEVPTGAINSSNVTFTLAQTPIVNTIRAYIQGVRQINGTHYTASGGIITFFQSPKTGWKIYVDYDIKVSNSVYQEVPTGAVDGVNVTFTISQTPTINTIRVYIQGVRQINGTHYTASGGTITFFQPPRTGWKIYVDYDY